MQKLDANIRTKIDLAKGLVAKYSLEDTIGKSPACVKMKNKAKKYALTNSTIFNYRRIRYGQRDVSSRNS